MVMNKDKMRKYIRSVEIRCYDFLSTELRFVSESAKTETSKTMTAVSSVAAAKFSLGGPENRSVTGEGQTLILQAWEGVVAQVIASPLKRISVLT
jgi:hypothetical protein